MPGLAATQPGVGCSTQKEPEASGALPGPCVDWAGCLGQLGGCEEWAQLHQDLEQAPGGGAVVGSVMLRALRQVAQQAAGMAGTSAPEQQPGWAPGGRPQCEQALGAMPGRAQAQRAEQAQRLVAAAQQAAWEKLHSGCWHEVDIVWRDAYSAACLLSAAAAMLWPAASCPSSALGSQPCGAPAARAAEAGGAFQTLPVDSMVGSGSQGEVGPAAAGVRAALRELDMAAIMGGPLFRPRVDSLIAQLQAGWQRLSAQQQAGGQAPAGKQQPAQRGAPAAGAVSGGSAPAPGRGAAAMGAPAEEATAAASPAAAAAATSRQAGSQVPLPPRSLGPRGTPVPVEELPSLERFWREYMNREGGPIPAIIDGAMENWPAMRKWADVSYLRAVAGPRTVPVEVGEHYLADQWGQKLMTLQDFIDKHIPEGQAAAAAATNTPAGRHSPADLGTSLHLPALPSRQRQVEEGRQGHQRTEAQRPGQQPQQCQQERQGQQQRQQQMKDEGQQAQQQQQQEEEAVACPRAYLAQHPLFEQIPALAADIREPDYCVLGEAELQSVNAWFGPPGTVTPLHTDPHHNLLCQVVGSKYLRIYTPEDTPALYPFTEGLTTNSSQVDLDSPDPRRFPAFASAPFRDCVLAPGQMLYLPPGWWHYVKALTTSFSVSFWWK
ncbi:hypothetical protein N2152v2_008394 [Parachlorella kessleri]